MKKTLALLLALVLVLALFAGCSSKTEAPAEDTAPAADAAPAADTADEADAAPTELVKIRVGATPTPHAEILYAIQDLLAEQGYDLEVVEYTDYIQPNEAVAGGDLDANYFQHTPYLVSFNAENGTDLVSAGLIHYEPFGIYAGKTASLEELAEGATIAIPNDDSNQTRALLLLQQEGIITLAEGADIDNGATVYDVEENPLNVELQQVEAAQLPNILPDVDIAVINGNYAIGAGLTNPLAIEDASGDAAQTYANIVAVKAGNENSEAIQALVAALQSQQVKDFIDSTYDGAVVAIF